MEVIKPLGDRLARAPDLDNRFRCRSCHSTFCARCRTAPFHNEDGGSRLCVPDSGGSSGATTDPATTAAAADDLDLTCRICATDFPRRTAADHAALQRGSAPLPYDCCADADCRDAVRRNGHCAATLEGCGHPCYGAVDATQCGGCLVPECANASRAARSDFCGICFVDELRASPCVWLPCGHVFHVSCVANRMRARWPGHRITFGYLGCPTCAASFTSAQLRDLPTASGDLRDVVAVHVALREQVEALVAARVRYEGLDRDPAVVEPGGEHHGDPVGLGMATLAYYECAQCGKPYFGGYRRCEAAMDGGNNGAANRNGGGGEARNGDAAENQPQLAGGAEPAAAADGARLDLVCGSCAAAGDQKAWCPAHGAAFIEYKCKFCCSVATYFCWGRTHFCSACHRRQDRGEYLTRKPVSEFPPCPAAEEANGTAGGGTPACCPLGPNIRHPPNGTAEYALGCSLCRHDSSGSNSDANADGAAARSSSDVDGGVGGREDDGDVAARAA